MRIVAPFGFYGFGNIGDEATLNGFARLLAVTGVRAKVWIGSRNPAHTAWAEPAFRYFDASRRDPRRWWAKLRASVHAVVGGTPIMDVLGDWPLCELTPLVKSIDRWKVPFVFIGVGIEDLRLDESRRLVVAEIAPRVRKWTVRCDRDRERLERYGVAAEAVSVAADMAWLIDPATAEFGRERLQRWGVECARPLIGVNLVNENSCFDRAPEMASAVAVALDELSDLWDAQVIFLSNEVRDGATFDKVAATKVLGRMKRSGRAVLVPSEYFSPLEMMSIVDCCTLTVSMRYHFCLFSALQGVPFIAIERSAKVSDLCWDLEWKASVLPTRLHAAEVVALGAQMRSTTPAVKRHLKECVRKMKARALRNIDALTAVMDPHALPPAHNSTFRGRS